jgi:hypothetical protein
MATSNIRQGDRVRVRIPGRWQHNVYTVDEVKVDGFDIEIGLNIQGRTVWFNPHELDLYRNVGSGQRAEVPERPVFDHDPESCVWCQRVVRDHWWGLDDQGNAATHCRECGATWRVGGNITHCVMCHRTFSTPRILEMHKLRNNQCGDPAERFNKHGVALFGEPEPNRYGTIIWSGAPRPGGWNHGGSVASS